MNAPHLSITAGTEPPEGIVVVLHGGRADGTAPVRARQLAVLRMIPIAHRIATAGHGRLAVVRVRNQVRGWNGAAQAPVADARYAIDAAQRQFGPRPIALVGHSMGGRAALWAAGASGVRSVVALAPWLPADDPVAQLHGRRVLIVHGSADRMTSPAGSAAYARRAEGTAAAVSYVEVQGATHSMLRHRDAFDGVAAAYVAATLLGEDRTGSAQVANIVRQALAGRSRLLA